MINLKEINAGIISFVRRISANIYSEDDKFTVLSNDDSAPARPSARVFVDEITGSTIVGNAVLRTITCYIYLYARDGREYRLENIQLADNIQKELLKPLFLTEDFVVYPEEINVDTVNSGTSGSIVMCSFDISMLEDMKEDTGEPTEELNNSIAGAL